MSLGMSASALLGAISLVLFITGFGCCAHEIPQLRA
jgi:hypothetical protein